jgi:hypothetical protein
MRPSAPRSGPPSLGSSPIKAANFQQQQIPPPASSGPLSCRLDMDSLASARAHTQPAASSASSAMYHTNSHAATSFAPSSVSASPSTTLYSAPFLPGAASAGSRSYYAQALAHPPTMSQRPPPEFDSSSSFSQPPLQQRTYMPSQTPSHSYQLPAQPAATYYEPPSWIAPSATPVKAVPPMSDRSAAPIQPVTASLSSTSRSSHAAPTAVAVAPMASEHATFTASASGHASGPPSNALSARESDSIFPADKSGSISSNSAGNQSSVASSSSSSGSSNSISGNNTSGTSSSASLHVASQLAQCRADLAQRELQLMEMRAAHIRFFTLSLVISESTS